MAAESSSQRNLPVSIERSSAQADATSRKVSRASGLLYLNISTATGVSAATSAAIRPATGPAARFTMTKSSPTVATPSRASGSSRLQELTPKMRPDSSISQSDAGGLSTVMKFPASNDPKKKAFQ